MSAKRKVVIGICAMQRKAESKPMREILRKMVEYYEEWLEIVIFAEPMILNEPIDRWPICDCLISFHATDFPLSKAIAYANLRQPYVINDLQRQYDLLNRMKVYRTLNRAGIEHPRHVALLRDAKKETPLVECADTIDVDGVTVNKPFVEKPVSAEDHNICIYYPSTCGGGSQMLFRKVHNRSSRYSSSSCIRREGSYIYEEFIMAHGTDVKVYAVGPYYAHAEARKSPALDGKVERDADGKEVRYPVILTNHEKMIARKIVLAFGQTVCGFDLLRAGGQSYVCDVNGFSFVKTSTKYYEDTAKLLGNMILRRLAYTLHIPWERPFQADDPPLVPTTAGKMMELRCVLAVIRHGDRTPKQKMKLQVWDKRFFELFEQNNGYMGGTLKMKKPKQLLQVLQLAREILREERGKRVELLAQIEADNEHTLRADGRPSSARSMQPTPLEKRLECVDYAIKKWDQLRTVLEMYGHFSGINRKIQLKYLKEGRANVSGDGGESEQMGAPSLLLIVKWGGELTTAGVLQAEALGKLFRTLYPGIHGGHRDSEDKRGLGFLRLHSTYRHDLKIYASDEGRVQMTAAAFAKGLLALEGELAPILVQMVKSANTDGLLDDDYNARQFQTELKKFLHSSLQMDKELTAEDYELLNPLKSKAINDAFDFIKNPRRMCDEILGHVQRMCDVIQWHRDHRPESVLYLNESMVFAHHRWHKLLREFRHLRKSGDVEYDISKIPDIYDNIKYDMEHNPELSADYEGEFERMYVCVKNMADVLVPQEYGIRKSGKLSVAQGVCTPLMLKVRSDLQRCIGDDDGEDENLTRLDPRASEGIATPLRHVRTRLYFTSESHIHSLMNLIRYGDLVPDQNDKKWQRAMSFMQSVTEFNYMTQMVIMLYEDTTMSTDSKDPSERFHVELLFSPGLYPCFQTEKEKIYEGRYCSRRDSKSARKASASTPKRSPTRPHDCALDGAAAAAAATTDETTTPKCSGECEDDMMDHTVNLVALGEIAPDKNITNEELARASPPGSNTPQPPCRTLSDGESASALMKSHSATVCQLPPNDEAPVGDANKEELRKLTVGTADPARYRFPYRFKHHTVNLLQDKRVENRLISTAVITGCNSHSNSSRNSDKKVAPDSNDFFGDHAVLSTAVIARSSSAPRLQIYTTEDAISVTEIRRFWPPLRSLETLHDSLSFRQVDDFLRTVTTIRTPIPSPPKTPREQISRENSDLYAEERAAEKAPDRTLNAIARRLSQLEMSAEDD